MILQVCFSSHVELIECPLIIGIGGEREDSQKAEGPLHVINEIDVVYEFATVDCILGQHCLCKLFGLDHALDGKREHGLSGLSFLDVSFETFVTVFGIDEDALVPPPHDGLPVIFTIFIEFTEVVRILSQSAKH